MRLISSAESAPELIFLGTAELIAGSADAPPGVLQGEGDVLPGELMRASLELQLADSWALWIKTWSPVGWYPQRGDTLAIPSEEQLLAHPLP